ncbi:MAG: GNAT family N-acetyltransferase, partial [Myxococcales bacterium]|nr:GNAT family N-acetyltransferase [Myxococcales bacterium]
MLQINDLPMTDAAYDAVWALNEAAGANAHIRGAIQRARDDARRPHGEVVRLIATLDGTPVGHAGAFPLVSYAGPGRRYCQLAVHPDHQGRGVGRALLQALLARLPDARELLGQLRAGDARARRVLDHLGGVVGSEDLEQRLLLADADVARLEALAGRLAALGLRVVPLARLKAEVPDWVARLHRLHVGLDEDVPSPVDHEPPDLDAWAAAELGVPDARHDALFLALDGDAWVGVCELRQPG